MSSYLDPFASSTNLKAQAIALPIFAALSIGIIITPFIWHYRNKNIAACTLIAWLILSNVFTFVNAIIWPDENFSTWWDGPGLCDVEAKLTWPMFTGVPAALACITRNLARVLRIHSSGLSTTKRQRRRILFVDCLILFLVPFLQLVLHYCIQTNRYFIIAVGGCAPSFDESWPTIVIMYIWPQIFALVADYYCILIIIRLQKYRSQFSDILASSNSNLTTSRFLRLFLMSFALMSIYTPVSLYLLYVNLDITWYPYSWSFIHSPETWNTVAYLPFLGIRTLDRWLLVAMTLAVFFFFGMGSDAIDIYYACLNALGFAKIWPSLAESRGRQNSSSSSTSWSSRLSLINKAKQYFDSSSSRKNSETELTSIVTDTRSRNNSTQFSSFEKKSMSSTTISDRHLSSSAFADHPRVILPTHHATLTPVMEQASSAATSFSNPFAQPNTSFPGISNTATPRHGGGIFGGHQGSSFNVPKFKFSPMTLLPTHWSRAQAIVPVSSPAPLPATPTSRNLLSSNSTASAASKAEERAKFTIDLASQYRSGVPPGLNPGWGPSPVFGSTLSDIVPGQVPALSPHGLQTQIYSSSGYSPHYISKERSGSAGEEDGGGKGIFEGCIRVKRKMEVMREVVGGGGKEGILMRDSATGEVYEAV